MLTNRSYRVCSTDYPIIIVEAGADETAQDSNPLNKMNFKVQKLEVIKNQFEIGFFKQKIGTEEKW